ncbi:MAG TPA: hypothetical protein VJ974_00205 [Geopsychrobacteraceae bacterium]|nr:hypothetical protein [Geopsychrobacteraceae bacterium]
MKVRFCSFILCLAISSLLMSACAGTKLQNVWKEDSYTEKVSSVLILGVTKNGAVRQLFEAELSRQLRSKGITAMPSFSLFNADELNDKEAILERAHENNVDSVIVSKVLDVKTYRERVMDITRYDGGYYRPYGYSGGWYGDYYAGNTTVRSYDVEYYVSHVETSLYLLDGEKLVWTALTETESGEDVAKGVTTLVEVLVEQLEKDGLI